MKNKRIFALSMAVLWSMVFGNAMHVYMIGICLGICIGIVFGLFGNDGGYKEDDNDEE